MIDVVKNRQIRIFISSTFKDMNEERNYLINKIFPRLQKEAEKRDVTIIPLDLRWGVTEEESHSGKVVEICLREIENSHPFFIGIVGNRYGWCPPIEELDKNENLKNIWGEWLQDDLKNGLSVTEIEMQYGVLRSKSELNANFFIKQPEEIPEENADKLIQLRNSIKENGKYDVFNYESIEELGEKIYEQIMTILNRLYPDMAPLKYDKEKIAHLQVLRSLTDVYIPNILYFQQIDSFLNDKNEYVLSIIGDEGIGKSALISNWIISNLEDSSWNIVYYFVGNGSTVDNEDEIIKYLITSIHIKYVIPPRQITENRISTEDELLELLTSIKDKKPLVIIIDGINKLEDIRNQKTLGWLPPRLSNNFKIILTTTQGDKTHEVLSHRGFRQLILQPLNREERINLVVSYLHIFCKKLNENQITLIADNKLMQNTLILKSMLNEMVNYGDFNTLDSYLKKYLNASDTDSFYQIILEHYENEYDSKLVRQTLSLIVSSRYGLSEAELLGIIKCPQLYWSQFFCCFSKYLITKNSLISVSNQFVCNAIKKRYNSDLAKARSEIIAYLKERETNRIYDELPCYYYDENNFEELYKCIKGIDAFKYIYENDELGLAKYWHHLRDKDANVYKFENAYLLEEQFETEDIAIQYNSIAQFIDRFFANWEIAKKITQRSLRIIKDTYGKSSQYTLASMVNMATYYVRLEQWQEAIDILLSAITVFEQENEKAFLVGAYDILGYIYLNTEFYDEAKHYLEKSIKLCEELNFHNDSPYNNIAFVYENEGNLEKALHCYKKSLDQLMACVGTNHPYTAKNFQNTAGVYMKMGKCEEAIKLLKQSVEIRLSILGENHPETAEGYHNLASAYAQMNKVEEALDFLLKAMNIREATIGKKHRDIVPTYYNIGHLYYYNLNNPEKAFPFLEKSVYAIKELTEKKTNDVIRISHNIAEIYASQAAIYSSKDIEKSIVLYEKSIMLYEMGVEDNFNELLNVYESLGLLYNSEGYYDKAKDIFMKRKSLEDVNDIDNITKTMTLNYLGVVLSNAESYNEAVSYFICAIETYQSDKDNEDTCTADLLNNLWLCYYELGDYEIALNTISKVLKIRLESLGEKDERTNSAYYRVGRTYEKMNNLSKAKWYYEHNLQLDMELYDERNKYVIQDLENIERVNNLISLYHKTNLTTFCKFFSKILTTIKNLCKIFILF